MPTRYNVFGMDGELLEVDANYPAMRLPYQSRYVPTGRTFDRSALFLNMDAFVSSLKRWREAMPDRWQYAALLAVPGEPGLHLL